MSTYERMLQFYAEGNLPWDDALPPPEVQELASELKPGRALDLGCGYGRAAIYLAQHGWEVDAVDFVEAAVVEARRRAEAAGVSVRFHHQPVTDLSFLQPPYDFAIDVGCAHAFDAAELRSYHTHLLRLLQPGGRFLIFGRLRSDAAENQSPGLDEAYSLSLFANGFTLDNAVYGETRVRDGDPWRSAWYWFTRQDAQPNYGSLTF